MVQKVEYEKRREKNGFDIEDNFKDPNNPLQLLSTMPVVPKMMISMKNF